MQAVAGGEASDLASLIAANLVQCVDETGLSEAPAPAASRQAYELRYLLLETLRTFAIEQLLAQGRLTTLQRLHADYFADYAQTVFGGIRGVDQAQWLQRVRQDHENFRAALRFALQHELGEIAIAIAGGLWWFWNRQGLLSEGSTWLAAALRCPRESAEMTLLGQKRRATALNGAGSLATEQSRFAEAHAYHMEGLALRQAIGDLAGAADVMHNLGLLARCQGDYPQAIQWFSESMANYSKLNGDSVEQAIDYANLGITAYEMGDSQLARRALEEAHSRALHQDDQWVLAFVVCALAEFLHSNGELERAARLATEASQIYQLLGDTLFLPEPLLLLAKIALRRGDLPQAQALCQQALAIYRSLDDAHGLANAYQVQAWLALHEQATEEEEEPAKSRAADLAKQAYSLRASVARAISPREQTEFVKLEQAVAGRATLLHSQDR
jgi:tetratricopeptide (TPR) repeat protein